MKTGSRYKAAINHCNFLLESSICTHYSNIVAENQRILILCRIVSKRFYTSPLFFTPYTNIHNQVVSEFNVTHNLYADDTQIYLAVDSRNFDSNMEELTKCLKTVQEWNNGDKLKLT